MHKRNAFTLFELIVTIIVIGVIAVMARPRFSRTIEAARARQAKAALRQIYTAERFYRSREGFYYPKHNETLTGEAAAGEVNCDSTINTALFEGMGVLETQANPNWDYSIVSNTADTFTATAAQVGGSKTITIDQTGEIVEN